MSFFINCNVKVPLIDCTQHKLTLVLACPKAEGSFFVLDPFW